MGIEPAAFGDGLRVFPHHVLESPFLPSALLPDALRGTFGKTQSLWDEATVGKLTQGLRGDTTARDVSTIRRYSKSFQEPNGELNVDITLEPIRNGGAMRRYRLHGGTLPAPTGNVPLPRGEEPRDGLALVVQFFIDAAERVEVDLHVPNCEPFGGKCHCKEPPGYVFDV